MYCQCYNERAKVWVKRNVETGMIEGSQKEKFEGVPVVKKGGADPEYSKAVEDNENKDQSPDPVSQEEGKEMDSPEDTADTTFFF